MEVWEGKLAGGEKKREGEDWEGRRGKEDQPWQWDLK